jgi:predicted naringenin-chalcone synthase
MAGAYLRRIATAAPEHDIHEKFVTFASGMLRDPRARSIFQRLAAKSGIQHRYSCLQEEPDREDAVCDAFSFYGTGRFPSTAQRMKVFERAAPVLLRKTLDKLALSAGERQRIRHVLVTCCTGFYAPGIDFDVIDYIGLSPATERTMLGFMGCYAAINALKLARHIVRSDPSAAVLVVNLELCTLHFNETQDLGEVISFTLFGDGCAASLVTAEPGGLELDSFDALRIEDSRDLITWRVGDLGFQMFLSTRVPATIERAMSEHAGFVANGGGTRLWAVHPGGRSVLDAVESGLALAPDALWASRSVLSSFGNMSSATVMFVLEMLMQRAPAGESGCAISFGPGVTAEIMRFHAA